MSKQMNKPSRLAYPTSTLAGKQLILAQFNNSDKLIPVYWDEQCRMLAGLDAGAFVSYELRELTGWLHMPSAENPLGDMTRYTVGAMIDNGVVHINDHLQETVMAAAIRQCLQAADGDRSRAAKRLGLAPATVGRAVKTFQLNDFCKRGYTVRKEATA